MPSAEEKKTEPKIKVLIGCLHRSLGASIDELARIMGWQAHSIQGAMAGALRKKDHAGTSDTVNGVRRYRLVEPTNA